MYNCKEVFRDVVGYEGLYQVSNYGRVKSVGWYDTNGKYRKPRFMKLGKKGCKGKYQHYGLVLIKSGVRKSHIVSRIMAEAFIPNPDNLPCVNHKDENPFNNFIWVNDDGSVDYDKSNLEWCSIKYNNTYGTARDRAAQSLKGKLLNRKDISKQVSQYSLDGAYIATYPSQQEAARQTGCFRTAISACCRGVARSTGGFKWSYA